MKNLSVKSWAHHIHIPNRREAILRLDHLVHNVHFWEIVALVLLYAAMLITLAVFYS